MELWVKVVDYAAAYEENGLDKYKGYIEVQGLGIARLSFHDEKHPETARNIGDDGNQNYETRNSFLRCQPVVIKNPMDVRKVHTHHNLPRYEYFLEKPEKCPFGPGPTHPRVE